MAYLAISCSTRRQMQQSLPEPDDASESRSLDEEIDRLKVSPEDAEMLRKMAREAEAQLGLPKLNTVTLREARPLRVPIAGVPRTFSAGRMLVIVTMFAVVFSLLQLWKAPAPVFPFVGGFCGAIVLGQMLLFGGRQPRVASCIVGACAMPLLSLIIASALGGPELLNKFRADPGEMIGSLLCSGFSLAVFGVAAGYVIGTFCAGVFLIVDRQWNAGQIVSVAPIEAEIVSNEEPDQDRPKSVGAGEKDPWSED